MRAYTEISAYLRLDDTDRLLREVVAQCAAEGMVRVTEPSAHPHHAPALSNNRWAVQVCTGPNGWHLLHATPWSLWCEPSAAQSGPRFLDLARRLGRPGMLLCVADFYPQAHGQVLIEIDAQGRQVATGHWIEGEWMGEGPEPDSTTFYGQKLAVPSFTPHSRLLKTLWRESQDYRGEEYLGDHDIERFCRYTSLKLLDLDADTMRSGDWPEARRHALHFEWPARDRPEPPPPPPPPVANVCYADGQRVLEGDAVLLDHGLASGRVLDFLFSMDRASMVVIDVDQPGKQAFHVAYLPSSSEGTGRLNEAIRLAARDSTDHRLDALRRLRELTDKGDTDAMFALGVRHYKGIDVARSLPDATALLTRAADAGNANAQYILGVAFHNPAQAMPYWRTAAEQGHEQARFELGLAHQIGREVELDIEQAVHWYQKAADQGNLAALYNLGHIWSRTRFAIAAQEPLQDADATPDWFEQQAEGGDPSAQWIMGQPD